MSHMKHADVTENLKVAKDDRRLEETCPGENDMCLSPNDEATDVSKPGSE